MGNTVQDVEDAAAALLGDHPQALTVGPVAVDNDKAAREATQTGKLLAVRNLVPGGAGGAVRAVYPLSSTAHRAYPSRASHSTSAAGEAACYMAAPRNAWGGSVFALASDHSHLSGRCDSARTWDAWGRGRRPCRGEWRPGCRRTWDAWGRDDARAPSTWLAVHQAAMRTPSTSDAYRGHHEKLTCSNRRASERASGQRSSSRARGRSYTRNPTTCS